MRALTATLLACGVAATVWAPPAVAASHLVFATNRDGNSEIYVMASNGVKGCSEVPRRSRSNCASGKASLTSLATLTDNNAFPSASTTHAQ